MTTQFVTPFAVTAVEIPGIPGAKGEKGDSGEKGDTGQTPDIAVQARTLPAGSEATAERSGTNEEPLITFGIPQGADGETIDPIDASSINNLFGV